MMSSRKNEPRNAGLSGVAAGGGNGRRTSRVPMVSDNAAPTPTTIDEDDDDDNENVDLDEEELAKESELITMETADEVRSFEEAKEAQRQKLEALRVEQLEAPAETLPQTNGKNGRAPAVQAVQAEVIDHRLQYLMKQSEIFSHFMIGDAPNPAASNVAGDATGSTSRKRKSAASTKAGRSRGSLSRSKTEDEEDAELLRAAESSGNNVTWLGEQPRNIVGGTMRACKLLLCPINMSTLTAFLCQISWKDLTG
jgi:hypothetical protein